MAIHVVTGGAGFIGSHLTRTLVSRGAGDDDEIIVIDNLSSGSLDSIDDLVESGRVVFHELDIRDKASLEKVIPPGTSCIFHLAADPRVKESVDDPVDSYDQNVTGTLNVLEVMRKKGIEAMVFASSGGTLYGDVDVYPTPENHVLKPISPYGASKAAAEMYLSAYAGSYNMKIASLRFANIYGPGSNHGVMYDFYHKLKKDPTRLVILGDGKQSKSYLFVSDCVRAMVMTMEWLVRQAPATFEAFNLGTPEWTSVTDIARIMVDLLGLENVKFEYTGGARGWVGDVPRNLLDTTKIQETIGWKHEVDIEQGMARFIDSLSTG